MPEIDLLTSLPKTKRDLKARVANRTSEHIREALKFGELYFDGPREYGYGGFRYDGRWQPVAAAIMSHYDLQPGDRVLDVGCAKGFLVQDLAAFGVDAIGIDISAYAVSNCHAVIKDRLLVGNAIALPFSNNEFKCVLSLDTIHNLSKGCAVVALSEFQRVSSHYCYIRVDSYHTDEQKKIFEGWALTAKFHDYPAGWLQVFQHAGYTGDYSWTIIE